MFYHGNIVSLQRFIVTLPCCVLLLAHTDIPKDFRRLRLRQLLSISHLTIFDTLNVTLNFVVYRGNGTGCGPAVAEQRCSSYELCPPPLTTRWFSTRGAPVSDRRARGRNQCLTLSRFRFPPRNPVTHARTRSH